MNLILPHGAYIPLMKDVPYAGIVCCLFLGVIAGCILAEKSYEKFGGNRNMALAAFISVPIVSAVLLAFRFGESLLTFKGLILMFLFLYASYSDIRTRKCADLLHVFILITALIGVQLNELPDMLAAGTFVFVLMICTSVIFRGRIGGADIKFSAACGFLLGMTKSLCGLMIGLILAIAVNAVIGAVKHRNNKEYGVPMLPYLAAGFLAAYFI